MATDVGDGGAFAESDVRGEVFVLETVEARTDIIEQREHGVALIDCIAIDRPQDGLDAGFGDALVGVGGGLAALGEGLLAQLGDDFLEGHSVVFIVEARRGPGFGMDHRLLHLALIKSVPAFCHRDRRDQSFAMPIETESTSLPTGPRKQRVVLVLDYQFNGRTQSTKIINDRPNKMLFCFLNT